MDHSKESLRKKSWQDQAIDAYWRQFGELDREIQIALKLILIELILLFLVMIWLTVWPNTIKVSANYFLGLIIAIIIVFAVGYVFALRFMIKFWSNTSIRDRWFREATTRGQLLAVVGSFMRMRRKNVKPKSDC